MSSNESTIYDPGATRADGSTTILDGAKLSIGPDARYEKDDTILDTYRVESEAIESGGMGRVWRVRHTGWNVDLAMKRPRAEHFADEKSKLDFIRECDTWIKLGLHPNIVSCYYVRLIDGIPTIFSEWMDGGDLADAIDGGGLYEGFEEDSGRVQERILDIAIQIARGLHYAHEARDENGKPKQIVHQDVKPGNVLLTKDGEAKVGDFGLAKARAAMTSTGNKPDQSEPGASTRSVISPSGGYTPAYCSMEQMDKSRIVTSQTDIYSWAVSVMELYVGSHRWMNGIVAGMECRRYFEAARVPVPAPLKDLLGRCLAYEPEDRPQGFGLILAELRAIYQMETGNPYPREDSKAAADTADSLNNRALSMLDLGKPEEAEKLWEKALKLSPRHSESLYNYNLHRWRSGSISDAQALFAVNTAEDPEWYKEQLLLESCAPNTETEYIRFPHSSDHVLISDDQHLLVDSLGCGYSFVTGKKQFEIRSVRTEGSQRINCYGDEPAFCLSANGRVFYKGNCGEWGNQPDKYMILSWDAATGDFIKILVRQSGKIETMFFDRCSNAIIGICADETVAVWDAQTGQCRQRVNISQDIMRFGTFADLSHDGKWILVYKLNQIMRLDVNTGKPLQTLTEEFDIFNARLTSGGRRIISASGNYKTKQFPVHIWDIESGTCVPLFDHKTSLQTVTLSPDETLVLTSDSDQHELLWDFKSGRCLRTSAGDRPLFSHDGNWILNRTRIQGVVMHKTPDFHYRAAYKLCRVIETSRIAKDQEQCLLLSKQIHENVKMRNISQALDALNAYRELPLFDGNASYWQLKALVEPYCIHKPVVKLIKVAAANPLAHFELIPDRVNLRSFGTLQLIKGTYGKIEVFDSQTQTSICQFTCKSCNFDSIYFSADGTKLLLDGVYSYSTGNLSFWVMDAKNGERLFIYSEPGHSVHRSYFSPDGTKILCLIEDNKRMTLNLVLIDALTGKPISKIKTGRIEQFAFTPDGKYCIAISNSSLLIYDLIASEQILSDTFPYNSSGSRLSVNHNATAISLGLVFDNKINATYHQLNWEIAFPGWADWDEGARPFLEHFLALHPDWKQAEFDALISRLQNSGFGWLRPEGIRKNLLQMAGMSEFAPR